MRLIIIALLVIAAIWVLVSGFLRKKGGGGVSWLLVVALLIPAGVAGWFEWRWQQEMNYISEEVVAKISGNPESRLDCQRLTFAFMDAESSEHTFDAGEKNVGIKYNQCSLILDYYRNTDIPKPAPTIEQAEALNLLSSESVRLAGKEKDADKVTCLGNKNLGFVVEVLGGTKKQGDLAAYTYQKEVLEKENFDFSRMVCFGV